MNTTIRTIALGFALSTLVACGGKSTEEHIALARQYLSNAEYDAATIELKNALQQDGASMEARWLLGKAYLDVGDAASAAKELQRAADLGWDIDEVRPSLAKALLSQGDFAAVRKLSSRGLEPGSAAQLLSAQAVAALAQGELAKAEKLVSKALAKDSDSLDAKMAEARILASTGDFTGSLIVLTEIQSEAPELGPAWSLQGDILLRQQQLAEARAAFEKSIELSRNSFMDRLKRALIDLQTGDYAAAQADADFLLKLAPQHPAGNYVQGVLHFRDEKYPEAITSLSVAEPAARQFPMILFYLGSAHLIEGNQDQAGVFASNFFALAPDNIAGRKLLATIRLQQGKFEEVRELMQPVLDSNPDDVAAMNLMANAQLRDGNTEQGISLLARIAELQPDSPAAQVRLGAGLLLSGQGDAATRHMETALELNPEFQQADILLVLNHLQKEDFEGAVEAAKAYRRRNPGKSTPLNLLGRVYLASGMQEEAKASFEKALTLDPGDAAANHNLAQLAAEAGDLAAARQYYQSTLEHHENDLSALLQLAMLDARQQDESALVGHLEQAIAAHPTALQPRLLLGRYYLGKGKPDQVAPLFSTLDEMQQKSPQVLQLLAMAQLSGKQHEDARYTLEQLIEATPATASSHHLLAMATAQSGDSARVKEELQRAVALDESYLPSLLALARLALAERAPADFEQYLQKVVALAPQAPDVLRLRAIAAQQQGDTPEAIALSREAFELAPVSQTMLELAAYQKAAGNKKEARVLQEQWIAEHPQDSAARLALANDLQLDGQVQPALDQYEAVLAEDADNFIALNNLAWHLREKNPAQALEYIRRAASLAPDRPEVLDTLAVIEHLNGEHRKAQRNVQRALANAPGNPSMLYHSAMIEAALGNQDAASAVLEQILADDAPDFPEQADAMGLLGSLKN